LYLDRVKELFETVDGAPFEVKVNTLYNMEGRGRRPKPPLAYLRTGIQEEKQPKQPISTTLTMRRRTGSNPGIQAFQSPLHRILPCHCTAPKNFDYSISTR